VTTPPLLCVEVLSPDDRMVDMQGKIDDYLAMGVPAIWVVNPSSRKAFVVDRGALIRFKCSRLLERRLAFQSIRSSLN